MGLDLSLYPIDYLTTSQRADLPPAVDGFSHNLLKLPRVYALFDAIRDLAPTPLPNGHTITGLHGGRAKGGSADGESVYGLLGDDHYGVPLTWIPAGQLAEAMKRHIPTHPATAYIAAMQPSTYVVLDWR